MLPEQSRLYLESNGTNYTYDDLNNIAQIHVTKEQSFRETYDVPILLDTDLLTIKIWSQEKYNEVAPSVLNHIQNLNFENRYYLLCKPDIPWEFDEQRENPNDRDRLYQLYLEELIENKCDFKIIDGSYARREQLALHYIKNVI